jgi:hypothetical protein
VTLLEVVSKGSKYVRPRVRVRCDACGAVYLVTYKLIEIKPERRCVKCASGARTRFGQR